MEVDRGRNVKNYTDDQLAALIDQSLKATARDVREGRVPLDGRARLPPPETPIGPEKKSKVPDAAE
jgi:hypothetical protein